MAITVYSELQTAVANWLERDDLTTRIPEFIALTEARLNRMLRDRQEDQRSTASITTEYVALPDNFGGLRRVFLDLSPKRVVRYITPVQMDTIWGGSQTGRPQVVTVVGNEFQFRPSPDQTYTAEIAYYKKISALANPTDTNWILTDHPDAYLYGSLLQAEAFLVHDSRLLVWKTGWDEVLDEIIKQDRTDRWNSGPLIQQSDVLAR